MMQKKDRNKVLSDNSKTLYATAVKELIIERLISLNDINTTENYEDYKAKKEAKKVIKDIFRSLKITEGDIKEQTKNQYE